MTAVGKQLRRGLKPFDPVAHAALPTAKSLAFSFNAPHYPIDKTGGVRDFGMFGNGPDDTLTVNGGQPVGDCGDAGAYHVDVATGGGIPSDMNSNRVVTDYFEYEAIQAGVSWRPPHSDNWVAPAGLDVGVDIASLLAWRLGFGGEYDEKAFMALHLNEVDAALDQFGAVIAGWALTDDTDQVFFDGGTVDAGPNNPPDPMDGHCMPVAAVESENGLSQLITWGGLLKCTGNYRRYCMTQAYVVITPEDARNHNFPYQQLVDELKAWGGYVGKGA